jgi:hypothetical protein
VGEDGGKKRTAHGSLKTITIGGLRRGYIPCRIGLSGDARPAPSYWLNSMYPIRNSTDTEYEKIPPESTEGEGVGRKTETKPMKNTPDEIEEVLKDIRRLAGIGGLGWIQIAPKLREKLLSLQKKMREECLAIVDKHDPMAGKKTGRNYWGNTLREALRTLDTEGEKV